MENLYDFQYSAGDPGHSTVASPIPPSTSLTTAPSILTPEQFLSSDSSSAISDAVPSAVAGVQILEAGLEEDEVSKALRDKIASHPLYPKLVNAYIDCLKVGTTPETEIGEEGNFLCEGSAWLAADPELDDFMVSFSKTPMFFKFRRPQTLITVTYCDLLVKYKLDLSRPFDEATMFLNNMEAQLKSLCNDIPSRNSSPDKATGLFMEDLSREEKEADEGKRIDEDRELIRDKLLRRYSGYISGLKHEFSKKKKREKLPKEATQVLLAWWNIHFNWPYPTEADKIALAEWTGLDQKQINNWFINQRKRHWKPSEEMQSAAHALDGLYGPFCKSD